jgi:2'-5' RNA ligase
VALLVPPPLSLEIDGLRRACGDRSRTRVAPHVTLVPPVNVRVEHLPAALAVLRDAAAATAPLSLRLGPVRSFLPDGPTLFLAVGGDPAEQRALAALRDAVFREPLTRRLTWPFVPHVTIADETAPERIPASEAALADFAVDVRFEHVTLLQETHHGRAHRRWAPVADYLFEPRRIVGRGGVELELTRSWLVDPEASAFETEVWTRLQALPPDDLASPPGRPLVVTARRAGVVVGLARGWCHPAGSELVTVVVHEAHRGQGIARQLRLAFEDFADEVLEGR